jgi:hypothetical protein
MNRHGPDEDERRELEALREGVDALLNYCARDPAPNTLLAEAAVLAERGLHQRELEFDQRVLQAREERRALARDVQRRLDINRAARDLGEQSRPNRP